MNVLILTPDRVGSTLLQRTLTVYMLRREFNKPVINLHELTNGLRKYYNTTLNQEVLGKPGDFSKWGYYQTLDQITDLLKSVDHYITSRLAHYHILNRKDTLNDQLKFYEYLNENFFVISCRRENVFEHGLSWIIQSASKKLNVYSAIEKVDTFYDVYSNGITAPKIGFVKYLNQYKEYVEWVDRYFNVQSYFHYEQSINNLEEYILSLDFMKRENNKWENMFDISFDDWNKCHKILPDLKLYENENTYNKQLEIPSNLLFSRKSSEKYLLGVSTPQLLKNSSSEQEADQKTGNSIIEHQTASVPAFFPNEETYNFIQNNIVPYINTENQLSQLVKDGFLITGIPIKLQTFAEKKKIIKNYDECLIWFNEWAEETKFTKPFVEDNDVLAKEYTNFNVSNTPLLK